MVSNTKENILSAAVEVFSEKGLHGSRMEEIADRAGANKAMVYYYYSTRNNLYSEALKSVVGRLFSYLGEKIDALMIEEDDPVERLRKVSKIYSRYILENQASLKILLEALSSNSDNLSGVVREFMKTGEILPFKFRKMIADGVAKKEFRDIDFGHFINAFLGLHLSFFIIRPIFTVFMDLDEEKQKEFLKQRETIVPELLLHGIVQKEK